MTRRSREVGIIKSFVLGAALAAALAVPAQAGDNKLALSATTVFTTDYMFRSISTSDQHPAVQPEFDLTYGMFYAGIWGSNTEFGDGVEIDYYAGITPKWNGTSPSTSPASTTPIPGFDEHRLFRAEDRCVLDGRRTGPLASPIIGRRIISVSAPSRMRSKERWATPSPASSSISSRPAISGTARIPGVRRNRPRLHLLERRPDSWLHGPLVCRRALL